jgi:hypothetical protein
MTQERKVAECPVCNAAMVPEGARLLAGRTTPSHPHLNRDGAAEVAARTRRHVAWGAPLSELLTEHAYENLGVFLELAAAAGYTVVADELFAVLHAMHLQCMTEAELAHDHGIGTDAVGWLTAGAAGFRHLAALAEQYADEQFNAAESLQD